MEVIKKIKTLIFKREILMYLIFGILTTIVNLVSFFILVHVFNIEENISNIIAIVLAIFFAYFTNSYIVFKTKRQNINEKLKEFFRFLLGRSFTMILEVVGFFLLFNILGISDIISKPLITIIVVILNYFISKYYSFK